MAGIYEASAGHHRPGIFTISLDAHIGQLLDELILLVVVALESEFAGCQLVPHSIR